MPTVENVANIMKYLNSKLIVLQGCKLELDVVADYFEMTSVSKLN